MSLHAVRNVEDALDATREFLLPIDLRRWLKLAVVAFFVGGGMNVPTSGVDASGSPERVPSRVPDAGVPVELPADVLPIVAALVVAAVLLAVVFGIVGAIMEFVLVESLRTRRVAIRRHWRNRWRQGLRLFVFRVAIGLPLLALFLGWAALFLAPLLLDAGQPGVPVAVFLLGVPILLVVGVLYALVNGFTTVFVVPIMIKEDTGVLAGWRLLWPSIRAEWKEYLAYAVIAFLLTIAAGLLASLVAGLAAFVLLVPFAVLAAITYLTVSFATTLGLAILAVLAVVFVASVLVIWALVQVPVVTYLRYYALLVLGDVEEAFDVVSEQRAAIRE